MDDFEAECRRKFKNYCEQYQATPYHSLKKQYAKKAYEAIDSFLDWREIQEL